MLFHSCSLGLHLCMDILTQPQAIITPNQMNNSFSVFSIQPLFRSPQFLLVYPASSSWDADEVYTLLLAAVPFLLGQFKSSTSPAPHFVTAFTLLKDSISCFAEHLAFGLGSCLLMGSFKLCLSSHISLKVRSEGLIGVSINLFGKNNFLCFMLTLHCSGNT